MAAEVSPEMRLFGPAGERLYLTAKERSGFYRPSMRNGP